MIKLIPEWKRCLKMASFQIALILIILESLQAMVEFMPPDIAQVVRSILIAALPVARLMQQNTRD